MMDVPLKKSAVIKKSVLCGSSLYMSSEIGTLRLVPLLYGGVRVSFCDAAVDSSDSSLDKIFSLKQGENLTLCQGEFTDHHETSDDIIVSTENVEILISKKNGSLTFKDRTYNRVLLKESAKLPREIVPFEVWRPVQNERLKVEEVHTADGIKRRITDADYVSEGILYKTLINLEFSEDEHLLGFGQSEEGYLDLRGTTQFLNQGNRKIVIPFMLSSRGYALLFTTESPMIFQDTEAGSFIKTEADYYLDYIFIPTKTPADAIHAYREISGKAAMLPRWAFGYMQSQERYISQEEILKTVDEFRTRHIPVDSMVLDWMSWPDNQWGQKEFDLTRFPSPNEMIRELHEKHVHFMISIWPNMTESSSNNKEMKAAGQLLPGTDIYNAYSEEGRSIYQEQLKKLSQYGVDAWWCDSSEPLTPEWGAKMRPEVSEVYHQYIEDAANSLSLQKGNSFGYYHALGIYDGERRAEKKTRTVNLTRSGYTGSQKLGTILWSGDTSASWKTFKQQVRTGLQFCSSGHPYWTLDIGAFFVKTGRSWFWDGDYPDGFENPAYRELYVRWFEYGAFLPVFRAHGTDVRREPWHVGADGSLEQKAVLKAIDLRYRLMPYIYSAAYKASEKDAVIMRPLCFDFPEDSKVWTIGDEYLFGDSILVCPILEPMKDNSSKRKVYLPAGIDWYDFYTEQRYEGGQTLQVEVPLDRIPLFVKAGAIIPMAEPAQNTEEQKDQPITLKIYPGADGYFELYNDAGDGYEYQNGDYCLAKITYDDRAKEVSVNIEGNIEYYNENVTLEI